MAELLPDQTAQNRSDLVSRIFKLKLNELVNDLIKRKFFDRTTVSIYVIEFQKRDLSHTHILLILHSDDKPRTSTDIDSIVCAEISCSITYPELYETIVS